MRRASTSLSPVARVAVELQYNGARFHGWERKPELRTVQGTFEDSLQEICEERTGTVAASKTDAGAHAVGQVVHFDPPRTLTGAKYETCTDFGI